MMIVTSFIRKHPATSYFILTFAISWGGVLLVIGGPGEIPSTRVQTETLFPIALVVMLAGPCAGGLILTGLVNGRAGLRELIVRCRRRRVNLRWYAVALLTTSLLATAALFALSLTSSVFLPDIVTADDKANLLLTGTAAGLAAGFFEEIGWTGFAVPRLGERYGVLGTGACRGSSVGSVALPCNLLGKR